MWYILSGLSARGQLGEVETAYSFLMELTTALVKGDDVGDSVADIVQ